MSSHAPSQRLLERRERSRPRSTLGSVLPPASFPRCSISRSTSIGLDFVSGRDNWDALKAVRFDKKLGAGIVDGRNTRIESLEQIADVDPTP